jgi:hypothetical protein
MRTLLLLEELESRVNPTLPLAGPITPVPLPLPSPLVPDPGDQQILNNVLKNAVTNRHVLDNLPVPYVILTSATNPATGQLVTTVTDGHAHSPIKIDADQSKSTGQGSSGYDIQVQVDSYVDPVPHLVMTVAQLGSAPFAQNLSVVIAFPFAGFDLEPGLSSTPNLVMGFQTRASGNTVGGYAPQQEVITLTPGTLAGTSHSFQATMATTGANNPLSFILGNLDGTYLTGTLNAAGMRAYVENVPATINFSVTTVESALTTPANSSFALNWQASSSSLVQLDYLENLTNPATAAGPDFNTSLTANQMPTNEQFSLAVNEAAGNLTLSSQANAAISQTSFQKSRSDGLSIVGNANNVPTQVALTVLLAGSATLTDNTAIGSLAVQASKTGGFADSSSFLGYNVATVGIALTAAPSLTAAYSASGANRTLSAAPVVAGNVIGGLEFLVSSKSPSAVQLPSLWSNSAWDIFSLIDTGTGDTTYPPVFAPGATAATRLLNLVTGTFTVGTAPLASSFELTTTTATPLQSYLRTTPTSQLTPGHDDEITCEIANVPAGETQFHFNGPTNFGYTTSPPASIGSLSCFGHIDTLNFDIDAGGLPAVFSFLFDPDSQMSVVAQDGQGGNASVGHLATLLADPNGISLFADAGTLFGVKLQKALMRIDNTPTLTGTWVVDSASGNTAIQFDTIAHGLFAGGIQFAVSTNFNDPALANPLTPAASLTAAYATFNDAGAGMRNMAVGVLGIDSFTYMVANASDMVHVIWDDNQPASFNLNVNSITGGVYFAGNQVSLTNNIALVPTHLDYMTTLDPSVCYTGTNFIPSIDLTFGQNVGLPAGTSLTIHANNLPAVLCYDFEAAAGTLTVTAENADLSPASIGEFLFDLEAPGGLPGTASLLGASFKQARLRLDSVPSFTASWSSSGSTNFNFTSTPPGAFLGGAQLELGTVHDTTPLAAASASSVDYITLLDDGTGTITGAANSSPIVITTPSTAGLVNGGQVVITGVGGNTNANGTWTIGNVTPTSFTLIGSTGNASYTSGGTWTSLDKEAALGVFGISQVTVTADGSDSGLTLDYVANAPHELQVGVNADFGQFFHNFNLAAALDIQDIPQNFNFSSDFKTMLNYTASSPVASITAGGGFDDGVHGVANAIFQATGLPTSVNFQLNPSSGATLTMSDAISQIAFALSDDTAGLFGSPYELVTAILNNIPAHWTANWVGKQIDVEAEDASNNPAPMGQVTATVSTSDNPMTNAAYLKPFHISGPGGARINYSPYLQAIDDRYFSLGTGAPATLAQIQNIYNNAQVLLPGEDHAVAHINGNSLAFFDGQFTGFQKILYQPNSNGGYFEFDAPSPGTHPLFVGVGLNSNFLIGHIDNIPSMASLNVDMNAQTIHFQSSASAGTIDVYYGPEDANGMAQDSDTALRAVLEDTPSDVLINWGFGFPNGSASFVASDPFTLLFLAQNGSNRLVGGFRLQELDVSYGLDILPLDLTVGTFLGIPTSANLSLFDAQAGINVGASGVPVDGFFNLYTMKSNPDPLNPAGPAPGASEYIPELTFMMRNFTEFSISLSVGVEILPTPLVPSVNVNVSVTGQFIFDVWQNSNINANFLGVGYIDQPDYTDNTPIQLVPVNSIILQGHGGLTFSFEGFSDLSDHFDPLA